MFCKDCPKRETCTRICPALEKHLSGQTKGQGERLHTDLAGDAQRVDPFDKTCFQFWNEDRVTWQEMIKTTESGGSYDLPGLTDLQKRCLYLCHEEKLTYAQIAMRVNKKTVVVRGQLERARAKLKARV